MRRKSASLQTWMAFASVLSLPAWSGACDEADYKYVDTAPHRAGFVTLGDSVRLHYLDFGGTGDAMLFLAGAGDAAHVFDEFAPRFCDAYHVLALTRRGFGESSQPALGYDTATLADDVHQVMDTLGIEQSVVVGHSLAGAEMTRLAVDHPEQVIELVYLDAAYDWAASAASPLPVSPPAPPDPTEAQMASPQALADYVAWISGVPSFPVAEIWATNAFDPEGVLIGGVTPPAIAKDFATLAAAQHPNYAGLVVAALAIFTGSDTPMGAQAVMELFPWITPDSPQWAAANAFFPAAKVSLEAQQASFVASATHATVIVMNHVPHYLFLAAPDAVESQMRAFLSEAQSP